MPLKINLKKDQKIILNGAVLENSTSKNMSFTLLNKASILRDSEILSMEDAVTPSARVYYHLQCAYIFPNEIKKHLDKFNEFLIDYEQAAPSCKVIADQIRAQVAQAKYYAALKECRKLIAHEAEILTPLEREGSDD